MLSSMNQTVSPCDNFYEFACGRWVLSNPIPDGRSVWGMFNQLEQANQLVIKNVLGKYRMNFFFHVDSSVFKSSITFSQKETILPRRNAKLNKKLNGIICRVSIPMKPQKN